MIPFFRTLCLLETPPIDNTTSKLNNKQLKTSKVSKPSSLRKHQKTWIVSTQSSKSKVICMSQQPVYKQFLDSNFKKDDDIIRLAPLIFKDPVIVNFDSVINYEVFSSLQVKSTYQTALKFQVQQLFLGRSSNIILLGSHNTKLPDQIISILCKNTLEIIKAQNNSIFKVGVSIQSIISNSICIDLLEEQTITSFQTMNGKPLTIIKIKYPQQINSLLYLCTKNKEKNSRLLGQKSKKQNSIVYKIIIKSGETVFSQLTIYSPVDTKSINQRQLSSLLQYIQNIQNNTKQYLQNQENIIIRSLINDRTISPVSISLIYSLINDKKHLQQNLITLNLAQAINQKIDKKQTFHSFLDSKITSNNRQKIYSQYSNNKKIHNSSQKYNNNHETDRYDSSSKKTRRDDMNIQLSNKVIHLENKLKQQAYNHQNEIQMLKTQLLQKQMSYKKRLEEDQQQSSLTNKYIQSRKKYENNRQQIQYKKQVTKLRQQNQLLVQKCKKLESVIQSKSKVEEKLQSVRKERNQLKETVKKMNQEIYQLIRDQEIDIDKLKYQ